MLKTFDLAELSWQVSGWAPHSWRFLKGMETGSTSLAEIAAVPAPVPGSVQKALLDAGQLPDWNTGLNAPLCEWVENRHWIYETMLPAEWLTAGAGKVRLQCAGLDYCGWVRLNNKDVAPFTGTFVPHEFDLTPYLTDQENRLQIVFECPPRWLGQFGYTTQMTEWKARFNYTWDWTARLVQIGVWDSIALQIDDGAGALAESRVRTELGNHGAGWLSVRCPASGGKSARLRLVAGGGEVVRQAEVSVKELGTGVAWSGLPVQAWEPNGHGAQPLYDLTCELLDTHGAVLDSWQRRVGFKNLAWAPCEGTPEGADPWLCMVNGRPVFLQGVDWTPIRPNFADVTDAEYRQRLELYRELGCNMFRVWGGAFLEKTLFYDLCDELGFLVWQEFPMSSSGVENWPPEDAKSISEMSVIAHSYIARRQHHVSLALWCGGNELQGSMEGEKTGVGKPIDVTHPMMARLQEIVDAEDPGRRFLPTSSSGPRFLAFEKDFGQGQHWDVHGPWCPSGGLEDDWTRYWQNDDALFRSETGAPGASGADLIRHYLGDCHEVPGTLENPLWRRTSWWIEWPEFERQHGRAPSNLDEYVAWSQERQAKALAIATGGCKDRFPRCGGVLLWMGHDAFPCTTNTAIIDFWGRPKPAALAVGEVFRRPQK